MTRQDLEDRLLDYLYDELEPSERSAFERALPAHPEVAREVAAHNATRKAYQALPRAAAPVGLLDAVLAEADQEAARRGAVPIEPARPAATEDKVPFWERVRRFVFQPTFAMAMVVLVVAGVSLVATKKGELPGTPTANDAQSLPAPPPVAVTRSEPAAAPAAPAAIEAQDRAAALALAGAVKAIEEPTAEVAPAAPEPAAPTSKEPTAKNELAREVADKKFATGQGGGVKSLDGDRVGGMVAGTDGPSATSPAKTPARPSTGGAELDGLSGDDGFDDEAGRGTRRDLNTPEDAVRKPAESPPAELAKQDFAPPPVETESDKRANEKGKEAPKVAEEREEAPRPDASKDSKPAEPRPADAPAPTREEVTRTDSGRVATIDDNSERKKSEPEPTLTPPAPTPGALWQTYQQQIAAGAYADAQRSIDQLAKLEGETPRVREARAELGRRRASTPTSPPAGNRVPPDPPVQPPK